MVNVLTDVIKIHPRLDRRHWHWILSDNSVDNTNKPYYKEISLYFTIIYLRETTTQSTVLQNIIQKARTVIVIYLYLLLFNSINLFEHFDYILATLGSRKVRANRYLVLVFLHSSESWVNHNSRDILTGLRLTCNNVFCLLLPGVTWAACVYSHCVNTVKLLTR